MRENDKREKIEVAKRKGTGSNQRGGEEGEKWENACGREGNERVGENGKESERRGVGEGNQRIPGEGKKEKNREERGKKEEAPNCD